jgi:hypothetical protein
MTATHPFIAVADLAFPFPADKLNRHCKEAAR